MALHLSLLVVVTLCLIAGLQCASWLRYHAVIFWLIPPTLMMSLAAGAIGAAGMLGLALYGLSFYVQHHGTLSGRARVFVDSAQLLLALAVISEVVFGRRHTILNWPLHIQPDAVGFEPSYHVEAVVISCLTVALSQQPWRRSFGPPKGQDMRRAVLPMALVVAVLIPLAAFSGYIRFEPVLGLQVPLFFVHNLLLAVVPEEVIFRGMMPHVVRHHLPARWRSDIWPMAVSAAIFGLAHVGGGPAYAGFSFIAGLGYGAATLRAQNLNGGIIAHVALNMVHLTLFTYPALQK